MHTETKSRLWQSQVGKDQAGEAENHTLVVW